MPSSLRGLTYVLTSSKRSVIDLFIMNITDGGHHSNTDVRLQCIQINNLTNPSCMAFMMILSIPVACSSSVGIPDGGTVNISLMTILFIVVSVDFKFS